ncbi:steroid delta-isomerase [Skermania sp. ID1734]|uniref:nuclear transport factor 2 family protein n=1 Tax=Skermania sp. ID1734 TaxID=2597516 RepID=UPI00117E7888|nr:nuclear transport factor 2 family protein [Skermania sp. ID1734]TSD99288.1 steroid delta-isomerase [Skermania sp. ID1734]
MATEQAIEDVVRRYVELVATGKPDEIVALYSAEATLEDPVGSGVRQGHAAIREFYQVIENMEQESELLTLRVAGNRAAFHFSLLTKVGDKQMALSPIDVMEFDEDAKITKMQAFWNQSDLSFT